MPKPHRARVTFHPTLSRLSQPAYFVQRARRQSGLRCHIQNTAKPRCVLSHRSRQVPSFLQPCVVSVTKSVGERELVLDSC